MKKLLLFTSILFAFAACSPDDPGPDPQGTNGTISYKVNGVPFSFTNGNVLKVTGTPGAISTMYQIQGFNAAATDAVNFSIYTQTDTLREQPYFLGFGTAPGIIMGTKAYTVLDDPTHGLSVNITDYSNAKVSGTFSGKLVHIVSVNPTLTIDGIVTEGVFSNIPVSYH